MLHVLLASSASLRLWCSRQAYQEQVCICILSVYCVLELMLGLRLLS
jgi:hypothetical protein